ncbi:hypothetical protein M404DRAFT_884955 [Pisolithus tinctorius Marx 270]|uniref:CCHC-type domain-containing protein n=1 Tax=Pisolithus tinctorius Marx 270 TaxID=870435 RepID=A0A0C3N9V4_PISTI|nr:hypothetical protein M404DRAFT_884955 [Pisolithus tinctorius Marx 270]
MASGKHILALGNGVWKCSKADDSCTQPPRTSDSPAPRRSYSFCFFCGLPGHIRANCHSCKSYLAAGKCLLVEGRVVLPTGQEIPREVAGWTLRDRLDNWVSLTNQPGSCLHGVRTGSSPTRLLSPTAAPSRSVFDTPSRVPARTSIMYPQSPLAIQLEPVVPDPLAVQSRHSSAERSRSSPHAQPQSRWPHGRGQSPSHRRSRSRSQTRMGSYMRSNDEFVPVQSYARSSKQYRPRRRSYSYSTNSSPPSSSSSSSSCSRSRSRSRKADSYVRSKPKRSRSRSRTPLRSRRAR